MLDEDKGSLEKALSAFQQYHSSNQQNESESYEKLRNSAKKAVKAFNILHAETIARRKATKNNFNLFTVLLDISDETRLHSRYLGHLLDPLGNHDCEALFLESFIKSLKIDELSGFDCKAATVKLEKAFGDGRIDILIESAHWGAIAIENKIWAGEQSEQLERYDKFLEDKYRRHNRNALLLFLTLDGRKSNTAGNVKYFQISYKVHIATWISYCLKETYKYININQALQQYEMVINKLTGVFMIDEQEKISEIIIANPILLKYLNEMLAWRDQKQKQYCQEFMHGLSKAIAEKGIENQIMDNSHCIVMTMPNDIDFRCELYQNNLSIGISTHRHQKKHIDKFSELFRRLSVSLCQEYLSHSPGTNQDCWPCGGLHLKRDFIGDNEFLVKLIKNETSIANEIVSVLDTILNYHSFINIFISNSKNGGDKK